jgi:hypothetical protein
MPLLVAVGTLLLVGAPVSARTERDFTAVDEAVRALPRVETIQETAAQLAEIASDEWERVRAVWIWITENIAYDTAAYFYNRPAATEPEGVFRAGRSVCQGYSELARDLGSRLGLTVVVISGYAKGYSYRPGRHFTRTNHAWNAVQIDGEWRLFDSTWGAGHVNNRRFVRDYGEFWFDPDPELYRWTHLPADPQWQLLDDRIDQLTYEQMRHIESSTFEALHDLGFDDVTILEAVRSGAGLPEAHSYPEYQVEIVDAPLVGLLESGEEISIAIRAPGVEEGAFIINNRDFDFFEYDGELFTGTISPSRGSLRLSLKITYRSRDSFWPLLEYEVR